MFCVIFCIHLCILFLPSDGIFRSDMITLKKSLLSNYSKHVRPIADLNMPMNINVSFALRAVVEFNEVSGELTVFGGLFINWNDEYIKWNPSQYGNITDISISVKKIWMPSFVLMNAADTTDDNFVHSSALHYNVYYKHTGNCYTFQGGVVRSICQPSVLLYPFDEHLCALEFFAFGFTNKDISLTIHGNGFDADTFKLETNPLWEILNAESHLSKYGDVPVCKFQLILRRKPLFIILNISLPVWLTLGLNLLAFLLPPESGERTSFSTSMFLSLCLTMTVMAKKLPPTSYPTFFTYSLLLFVFIGSFTTVFSIFIQKRVYKATTKKIRHILCCLAEVSLCNWKRNKRMSTVVETYNVGSTIDMRPSRTESKTIKCRSRSKSI